MITAATTHSEINEVWLKQTKIQEKIIQQMKKLKILLKHFIFIMEKRFLIVTREMENLSVIFLFNIL